MAASLSFSFRIDVPFVPDEVCVKQIMYNSVGAESVAGLLLFCDFLPQQCLGGFMKTSVNAKQNTYFSLGKPIQGIQQFTVAYVDPTAPVALLGDLFIQLEFFIYEEKPKLLSDMRYVAGVFSNNILQASWRPLPFQVKEVIVRCMMYGLVAVVNNSYIIKWNDFNMQTIGYLLRGNWRADEIHCSFPPQFNGQQTFSVIDSTTGLPPVSVPAGQVFIQLEFIGYQ